MTDKSRIKETAESLRQFNKWRRGKGRKYLEPGCPFDPVRLGKDIDIAVAVLLNISRMLEKVPSEDNAVAH